MKAKTFQYLKAWLQPYRKFLIPFLPFYVRLSIFIYKQKCLFCSFLLKKKTGNSHFAIVSACYNVEPYLDEFIQSLVHQTLDFKNNIELILVDDGSTDHTSDIIQKWVTAYPENIRYFHQDHEGQASARNLGLQYVSSPWVTFIDPDDFLDCFYFEAVDRAIQSNLNRICLVSTNTIFFHEHLLGFVDSHPLNYRYAKTQEIRTTKDLDDYILLSVATSFFRTELICSNKCILNIKCKPHFEDALFLNQYLAFCQKEKVIFLKNAKYYYRKREDRSSTLDQSWSKKENFSNVLSFGYLGLLRYYHKHLATIPQYIYKTVLYSSNWYIRNYLNRSELTKYLTETEKKNFHNLLKEVYSYISIKNIEEFAFRGLSHFEVAALLIGIKGEKTSKYSVLLEKYDANNDELLVKTYLSDPSSRVIVSVNDREIEVAHRKIVSDTLLDHAILHTLEQWIPLNGFKDGKLSVKINGASHEIFFHNRFQQSVSLSDIRGVNQQIKPDVSRLCWLISDRDIQADDNGEHFYRYLQKNHPEQEVYFLLNKNSHDWNRLKTEGFKLVSYGSRLHRQLMEHCGCIISSHAEPYIKNYFRNPAHESIPYVFLQHGVIKDDLSRWLNSCSIDLLITSTQAEYDSIAGDFNRYKFTSKEVVLTGLPRHDALVSRTPQEHLVIVMPTWRSNLVGLGGWGHSKFLNKDFMQTIYANAWKDFLTSDRLKNLCKEHGVKVIFFPHSEIQPYLSQFDLPCHIGVRTHHDSSIQELFTRASLLITDYSSVAFEMAYLGKSTIYYQFDHKDVLEGRIHSYQKGYFDYQRDGFGEIVYTEKQLLDVLEKNVKDNFQPTEKFLKRMQETFAYRDGKCCERVYSAICKMLNRPE